MVVLRAQAALLSLRRDLTRFSNSPLHALPFKDPLVTIPLPPEGGRASFTIRMNAMEKDAEVAAEKVNGGRISIRDNPSNCELVGKTVGTGVFAGAEIPWDDLRECLQPLLEGLRR